MAYTAGSFTFGEVPTTAKWNQLWSNDASFNDGTGISAMSIGLSATTLTNKHKFYVYRAAANTTASSHTKIDFDTTLFDTGSNVTTNDRFTAPVNGFYWFAAQQGNTAATGTAMQTSLYKNGAAAIRGIVATPDTAANLLSVSGIIQLAATDYVEAFFIGGSGSTGYAGADTTYFMGFLISEA